MTTIGGRKWKQTQERTGPLNNLGSEGPEEHTERSRAGSTVLTSRAMNLDGERWMPAVIPYRWEEKRHCRGMIEVNTRKAKP